MKKILRLFPLVLITALGIAGCSSKSDGDSLNPENTRDPDISAVYSLYVQSGGTLSYDDWMKTITGAKGDKGDAGIDGKDGKSVLTGQGAPGTSKGNSGDVYIDIFNWDIYRKVDNEWIKVGNIKGPKGDNGNPGDDGDNGDPGDNGASAYQIYVSHHPEYTGTEEQWLDDLANGRLADQVTHTVTFDPANGEEPFTQTVAHGEKVTKPTDPVPSDEDLIFDGWVDENGDKWVFNGYGVNKNLTLTATWVPAIYLKLDVVSKQIDEFSSFQICYSIRPMDATISWSSSNEDAATVSNSGCVSAVAPGYTVITATGSNGKIATCYVTVTEYVPDIEDTLVDSNLGWTGELKVGVPTSEVTFMTSLLADFNTLTNSSIEFTIVQHETANGTDGYANAAAMPAIFTYDNGNLASLLDFGALSPMSKTNRSIIRSMMDDDAYNASYGYGFPYKANTTLLFYNKSYVSSTDANTLNALLNTADNMGYDIGFDQYNGYYVAPILATFMNDFPYITALSASYHWSSSASFKNDVEGAKLLRSIQTHSSVKPGTHSPTSGYCATFADSTIYRSYKSELDDNLGVAPLPYVDNNETRLHSYNTYTMYGVNNELSASERSMANYVARFLISPYAQNLRFEAFEYIPTISNFLISNTFQSHPLIEAYIAQKPYSFTMYGTLSNYWNYVGNAAIAIKSLKSTATDSEYLAILTELDTSLYVE